MDLSWNPYTDDRSSSTEVKSCAASPPVDELEGRVYIARLPEGYYKIGSSHLPMKRMHDIAWHQGEPEVEYPKDIQPPCRPALVHCFPANGNRKAAEDSLHKIGTYNGWHIVGEWFDLPRKAVEAFVSINAYDEPYFKGTRGQLADLVPEGGLNAIE
ncbi:MAG: hypothetical protein ABEL51_07180 [Salinibacter sp.]